MKRTILTFSAVLLSLASFGGIRSITPDMYGGKKGCWQLERHRLARKAASNTTAKVVFIGDSITHFWENAGKDRWKKYFADGEMKAINLGTSADRTEHVLWRIGEGGELDGYEAKCVVLMIGTNNSGHFKREEEPVGDTILGVREILKVIRAKQPKAKIVLCAIFPRGRDMTDSFRQRNDLVNKEIMKFSDGQNIFWCDFRDQFMTQDGRLPREIFPDELHPADFGYELWASAVIPYIRAALHDLPMPADRYAPFCREQFYSVDRNLAVFPAARVTSVGFGANDWWLDRYQRNREQILASGGKIDLVFAGDSITHNWESQGKESLEELRKTYSVLDIGYSGDRTEHLLWRCENGELDGYEAKCIMVMIGTNNAWHRLDDPAFTTKGIRKILDVMRKKQPQAKIVLLPIFPFGKSAQDRIRVINEKVNAIIKGYADETDIFWVDFNAQFLDEKGDMTKSAPDGCHPDAAAYKDIWLKNVLPYFRKFVGK